MKLPYQPLELRAALDEFDVWITPALDDIIESPKFASELSLVCSCFDIIEKATDSFAKESLCTAERIGSAFAEETRSLPREPREETLLALASTLYLVTGQSDNNTKCQLPLYLRDVVGWNHFPVVKRGKVSQGSLPRELKASKYMNLVSQLKDDAHRARLIEKFVSFLLQTDNTVAQLWSIGRSYSLLKTIDRHEALLTPLVIYKVRGSVSASGGHVPEDRLREMMTTWGMMRGVDTNPNDVVVVSSKTGQKTRAYDFVLPYQSSGWPAELKRRLFIQCQFYAGDSGSVSHKNVDQTTASRAAISAKISDAKFIEYVDGAGYFSSLNGDLRKLLSKPDTHSFFQLRSAPIRLRRELQRLGFLTLLEIEHAVMVTGGLARDVHGHLRSEGYAPDEIELRLSQHISSELLLQTDGRYIVHQHRDAIARRYMVLDLIAVHGSDLTDELKRGPRAFVLVPGYGPFHGLSLVQLLRHWENLRTHTVHGGQTQLLGDVEWLCRNGHAMMR